MACNKCRQSAPRDGDTWCLACSSWEALGQELTSRWSCSSSRRLADDLVLSVTRQVRFLRNLSAGIRANAEAAASRGERPAAAGKRAREDQEDKPALQRRREASQLRPLELSAKKRSDRVEKTENSDTEDKFEEDTEEEELVEVEHRPLGGSGDPKPPEPKGPPPTRRASAAKGKRTGDDTQVVTNANIAVIAVRINTSQSTEQVENIRGLAGWSKIRRGPSIAS